MLVLCNKHHPIYQNYILRTSVINLQFALQLQMEIMKAVSFMYVCALGYNAESAKATEIEDEKRKLDKDDVGADVVAESTSSL